MEVMKKNGFSLIELLVVISIILLTVGGGIAGFLTFNDKQTVLEGMRKVKSYFQVAQGRAQAGEIPPGCTGGLDHYAVRYHSAPCSDEICVVAVCGGGTSVVMDQSYTPVNNLTISLPGGASGVQFLVLGGGVVNSGNIEVSYSGRTYNFDVSSGGDISDGDWN